MRSFAFLCACVVWLAPDPAHARKRGAPPPVHATSEDPWADSGPTPISADIEEGAAGAAPEAPPEAPKEPPPLPPELQAQKQVLMKQGLDLVTSKVEAEVLAAVALANNELPGWESRCCHNGLSCDFNKGEVFADREDDSARAGGCADEFNGRFLGPLKLLGEARTNPEALVRRKIDEYIVSDPEMQRIARGLEQIQRIEEERRLAFERYKAQLEKLKSKVGKCRAGSLRERKHCLDILFDGVPQDLPVLPKRLPGGDVFFEE